MSVDALEKGGFDWRRPSTGLDQDAERLALAAGRVPDRLQKPYPQPGSGPAEGTGELHPFLRTHVMCGEV